MLTQSATIDYAPFNICVNGICPGWWDTTFNDAHTELFGALQSEKPVKLKELLN